jgi:hypothetical protein
MNVATLFARIGIKADTEKAKEFSEAMKEVSKGLKTAAIGAAALTTAIVASMKGAMDTAKTMRDFQNETGASTDELQRWQAVAGGANVSTQDLADSVKSLAQNREKIKLGQGNMSGFAFLGINPMDDPFSILDQLRTKTAGLPQAMKANLLAQMGVSSQFLEILNLTNDEFDRMKGGAFVIPSSAFAAMNQLQGSLNGLGKMFQWFQSLLAEKLAPIIDKVVKQIMVWVQQNKNGLIDGIVKGTQLILKFIEAIINVATWIVKIVNSTVGWKNAIVAFGLVWAVFNRQLLMSPIAWIVGGIILLIAVLDDLHAALHVDGDNRKSFFGDMLEKNPALNKFLQSFVKAIGDVLKMLKELTSGNIGGVKNILDQWGEVGTFFNTLLLTIGTIKQALYDLSIGDFKGFIDHLTVDTATKKQADLASREKAIEIAKNAPEPSAEERRKSEEKKKKDEALRKSLSGKMPTSTSGLDSETKKAADDFAKFKQGSTNVNVNIENKSQTPIQTNVKTNPPVNNQTKNTQANRPTGG